MLRPWGDSSVAESMGMEMGNATCLGVVCQKFLKCVY